jgi:hypothetical protein
MKAVPHATPNLLPAVIAIARSAIADRINAAKTSGTFLAEITLPGISTGA